MIYKKRVYQNYLESYSNFNNDSHAWLDSRQADSLTLISRAAAPRLMSNPHNTPNQPEALILFLLKQQMHGAFLQH